MILRHGEELEYSITKDSILKGVRYNALLHTRHTYSGRTKAVDLKDTSELRLIIAHLNERIEALEYKVATLEDEF
jgi:hypothetical protein